jgi:hypothetical protein
LIVFIKKENRKKNAQDVIFHLRPLLVNLRTPFTGAAEALGRGGSGGDAQERLGAS